MVKIYIAKPDSWFKTGTEVKLVADCGDAGGIFVGTRVCENSDAEGGRVVGEAYEDEELCSWDEFDVTMECRSVGDLLNTIKCFDKDARLIFSIADGTDIAYVRFEHGICWVCG